MDSFEALILSAEDQKDSDRLLTLLDQNGRVFKVYASHARSAKSRMAALTEPFVYGRFEVKQNASGFILRDVEAKECFMGLQKSLSAYALAAYLAELTTVVLRSEAEPSMLPFLLNTLYLLAEGKRPMELLKGIYEFRMAVVAGYAPSLDHCSCQTPTGPYLLSVDEGRLYCHGCRGVGTLLMVPNAALEGMRRACFGKNPFGFNLSGESLLIFSRTAERYLRYHLDLNLDTLDYYHDVTGTVCI